MKSPVNLFYTLLGILLLTVAGGVAIYLLMSKQLVALNNEIAQTKADEQVLDEQIKIYEDASNKVTELGFVVDIAQEVLPPTKEQANAIAEIRKFVTDSGMVLESISFTSGSNSSGLSISQTEAVQNLSGVRVQPVNLSVASGASYAKVLDLLRRIENNQRKMQVTEVTLTPEVNGASLASVNLKINVYQRTPGAAASTEEAPTAEAES